MEDLKMEHGFLKAPWEVLVRRFRAGHKPIAKELELFSSTLSSTISDASKDGTQNQVSADILAALHARLLQIKKRIQTVRSQDDHSMRRCYYRVKHLQTKTCPRSSFAQPQNDAVMNDLEQDPEVGNTTGESGSGNNDTNGKKSEREPGNAPAEEETVDSSSSSETEVRWEKLRLDRALVDYMLREGMYDTAEALSTSNGIEKIVDMDSFRESRVVIEALRRRDCAEGLRWCSENRRRLQKVQSKLEFRLRLQEFVEHARAGRKTDAIKYMTKFLASSNCDSERLLDIQRFMALLAFEPNTSCQPYKDMYSERKWLELEVAFKRDNYKLHGLTRESTIEIMLKAGLASLKTRKCGTEAERKSNCPTCVEPYLSLAQSLPRGRHENSILVCSISGEIMDENNPPMALPNGNVYSYDAIREIADENDGVMIDPKTQQRARMSELRKCFVM